MHSEELILVSECSLNSLVHLYLDRHTAKTISFSNMVTGIGKVIAECVSRHLYTNFVA